MSSVGGFLRISSVTVINDEKHMVDHEENVTHRHSLVSLSRASVAIEDAFLALWP